MDYKHFIGIDVSKNWLDITVMQEETVLFHQKIGNTLKEIKSFFRSLKPLDYYNKSTSIVCMEHTGIYNNHLLAHLGGGELKVCLESGSQIKQSGGITRGKSDKVDSARIAAYAYRNRNQLRLWEPPRKVLIELKQLTTLRNRLLNALTQLKTPLKENAGFIDKSHQKKITDLSKAALKAIAEDLKRTNEAIKAVIKADPELNRLFNLVSSVTGIGAVTATQIILTTNEFKSINCPKKYACYSGIAPFEHQSGSSIRGKTRVSHMANKSVKKLLHMAALSASISIGELKLYYDRKVNEGKNKMLVINALRNKIINRVFACVKHNKPYQKDFFCIS